MTRFNVQWITLCDYDYDKSIFNEIMKNDKK